jgi:hypothetical protein
MMPKEDKYYFSGLDDGGWLGRNFSDYSLFGYIGDRERLQEAILQNRSLARKVFEIVLPRLKISSLLTAITGFDLPKFATDSGLAKELFVLLAKEENRRTVYEQLTALQRRALKDERFFQRVARKEWKKAAAMSAPPRKLEDKLVTVEGQLIHRDTVPQHSKTFSATLRASKHEWILCDYPPHALNEKNQQFTGSGLLLQEDAGFSKAFASHLPFNSQIGWYPYVRVTGFYSSAKANTEKLPSLSMSIIEYREPKKLLEVRPDLLRFIGDELKKPIYLAAWSDLVLFSYLPPLILEGSNVNASEADLELSSVLRTYADNVGSDIPSTLTKFYGALPVA